MNRIACTHYSTNVVIQGDLVCLLSIGWLIDFPAILYSSFCDLANSISAFVGVDGGEQSSGKFFWFQKFDIAK